MIRFSDVNCANGADHRPNYQKHHLIPVQAVSEKQLGPAFQILADNGFDLDDFKNNGILLPSCEREAVKSGLPLHRGPHPRYNELVIQRLVKISRLCDEIDSDKNRIEFLHFRIKILQGSLRLGLASRFKHMCLNSRDPLKSNANFSLMDSQIDRFYQETESASQRRANFSLKSHYSA